MVEPYDLPVADPGEVRTLLRDLPLALDAAFVAFVVGFPRKYLATTPRAEIVKHYGLMASLGTKAVISSLARDEGLWKLCLIARDRQFLFSRIAGALTCHGMNILSAEAFANANSVVLDTFRFSDDEGHFEDDSRRRRFQAFLEDAVEGKTPLEPLLAARLAQRAPSAPDTLAVETDDTHPAGTRLSLHCRDHFGLLYMVSRCISEAGYDIEVAAVETVNGRVQDQFVLTRQGRPLDAADQEALKRRLADVAERYFRDDPELMKRGD